MNILKSLLVPIGGVLTFSVAIAADQGQSMSKAAVAGNEARMYLRHAKECVHTLYSRAQARLSSSPEAQDLVSRADQSLQDCVKALDQLRKAENATRVNEMVGRLNQHVDKVQHLLARLATESKNGSPDAGVIVEGSAETWREIDAIEIQMSNLLNELKIVRLTPPPSVPALPTGGASSKSNPSPTDAAATIGNGFRPRTAAVYHHSALENARALSEYSASKGPLPESTILEHLAEIDRQLSALQKEYAKLDSAVRKEKELEQEIKAVEEQQSNAKGQVDRLKKSIATRKLNPTELKETTDMIYWSVNRSLTNLYQVMGNLGVQQGHGNPQRPYSD